MAANPAVESYPIHKVTSSLYILPAEIRILIWRLCIPTHRKLSAKRTFIKGRPELSFRDNDVPVVLELCQESRDEARKVYKPLFKPGLGLQFYVHDSDSLSIETGNGEALHAIGFSSLNIDCCGRRVAALAPSSLLMKLGSVMHRRQDYECDWCHSPFSGPALCSVYLIRPNAPPKCLG